MSEFGMKSWEIKLDISQDAEPYKIYSEWKQQRLMQIKPIGQYLLTLSEVELLKYYDTIETNIEHYIKTDQTLLALLNISILHYFNRSVEKIRIRMPYMEQIFDTRNRANIMCAMKTFAYMSTYSNECLEFMRKICSKTTRLIDSPTTRFSALYILKESGKYILPNVFEETSNSIEIIIACLTSDDTQLQLIAAKVLKYHFKYQKSLNTQEDFLQPDEFFDQCMEYVSPEYLHSFGHISALKYLIQIYRQPIYAMKILSKCSIFPLNKAEQLTYHWFELLITLIKDNSLSIVITPDNGQEIIASLFRTCKKFHSVKSWNYLIDFLNNLHKTVVNAYSCQLQISELLKEAKLPGIISLIYNSLAILQEKYSLNFSSTFFTNYEPSLGYLVALSKYPKFPAELKKTLQNSLNLGLSERATIDQIKISISIMNLFWNKLYENPNTIYDEFRKFVEHKNQEIRILISQVLHVFTDVRALQDCQYLALFDKEPSVRAAAVKQLIHFKGVEVCDMIPQVLTDPNFEVKKTAIKLISKLAPKNPMIYFVPITLFVQQTMQTMSSSSDPDATYRISTLLPYIAKHLLPLCPSFIPQIMKVCYKFLNRHHKESKQQKLISVLQRDVSCFGQHELTQIEPFDEMCTNLNSLFKIHNKDIIDDRDANLFDTLKRLSDYIKPYLDELIPIYMDVFQENRSPGVYEAALNSLIDIVNKYEVATTIPQKEPEMARILINLLRQKPSENVSILVLKLLSTFGITDYPHDTKPVETKEYDFKSSSYYTDSVMAALIRLFPSKQKCVFQAVMSIFVTDPSDAVKFLDPVIEAYKSVILTLKTRERADYYKYLEVICYHCGIKIKKYASVIAKLISLNIEFDEALKVGCVLSQNLKTEFTPYIMPLFHDCLKILSDPKYPISKALADFVTFCVIFQNQPITFLISAIEARMAFKLTTEAANLIIEELTLIVQLCDSTFECTRIARLCEPFLKTPSNSQAMQLLYSLAVYSDLSFEFLKYIVPEEDIGFPALRDYLDGHIKTTDSFLSSVTASLTVDIPSFVPQKKMRQAKIFDMFQHPCGNNEKWLDDLCRAVIVESPKLCVNACYETATQFADFKIEIFPIAFLSCWQHSKQVYRDKFSRIISEIFSARHPPDQILLNLAETLIRAGCGFNISEFVLARASTSPLQSLRFLIRYFQDNHHDKKAIEMLLGMFTQLGRIQSCRGILKYVDLPSVGQWSLTLGEWDKALEIFDKESDKSHLPERLLCYARLERWSDIVNLFDEFQDMGETERSSTALWYAWAALKHNDFNSISGFTRYLAEDNNLDVFLFRIFFHVQTSQYEKAKLDIEHAMRFLVSDCSIYTSINANQAKNNLMYSCLFTELGEVIEANEKHNRQSISERWERRLLNISGDGYSWMRLAEIRSLVINPTENTRTYLKLLAVLAKDRKWHLIDIFEPIVNKLLKNPNVVASYVKILWLKGKTADAIDTLHIFNDFYRLQKSPEFFGEFQQRIFTISEHVRNKVASIFNVDPDAEGLRKIADMVDKPNSKELARLLRLEGSYRASDIIDSDIGDAISLFSESTKYNPDDYRTWASWAYACMKSLEGEREGFFVQMAVDGFLRANVLTKTSTLEYICQLFSLFFRYGNMCKDFNSKIQMLEASTIEKIIPQLVCQISHPDEGVRNVVTTILTLFARPHFQALVFQLQLIANSDDNLKSKYAKDLLLKLSEQHKELAVEASLFAKVFSQCAVTYFDIFISKIDEANSWEIKGEREKSLRILKTMSELYNPPNALYQWQFQQVEKSFKNAMMYIRCNDGSDEKSDHMWFQLKKLYDDVRKELKSFDSIQIEKVSVELATKHNFVLAVPGTYTTTDFGTRISYIEPTLIVLGTQQHPAISYMVGDDGVRWKFLLKGNEDLRLDQRIMQFFVLINSLLPSNKLTQKMNISILNYTITPLAVNAGLISWVLGADTMHQLINDHRKATGISPSAENEIIQKNVGLECAQTMNSIQRLEWWPVVTSQCPATDLREMFWLKSPNPVNWIRAVDTFVLSIALMSFAGYVVGLGDRHPSNIMIRRNSGHCVHIDLGDSFEVTQKRTKMPEKVPFRLTRQIVNALGVSKTEGNFRKACENIMYMLRYNKPSIFAQLEIFVHEPIFQAKALRGDGNSIMKRVGMKLNGLDPELFPGVPVTEELSIEEQTDRLITIATDPMRYVTHYDGWCPYW